MIEQIVTNYFVATYLQIILFFFWVSKYFFLMKMLIKTNHKKFRL